MRLLQFPRLLRALDLMGVDNGASPVPDAEIPDDWEQRVVAADIELQTINDEQMETLVMGEETEGLAVAQFVPNAYQVLNAAFDSGPLSDIFFDPWGDIFDARDAEARVYGVH